MTPARFTLRLTSGEVVGPLNIQGNGAALVAVE